MLLALAQKLLKQAQHDAPGVASIGTLTLAEFYPVLHYGEVEGIGTVTIDKTGNMVGFSPVERCSINGETAWIPLELVKNLRTEPFWVTGGPTRGRTKIPNAATTK
jgi:hypothetical protein